MNLTLIAILFEFHSLQSNCTTFFGKAQALLRYCLTSRRRRFRASFMARSSDKVLEIFDTAEPWKMFVVGGPGRLVGWNVVVFMWVKRHGIRISKEFRESRHHPGTKLLTLFHCKCSYFLSKGWKNRLALPSIFTSRNPPQTHPNFNSTNPQPPKTPPHISLSSPGTDDGDDKDGDNDIEASLDSAVCCQIWWTGRVHLKSEMKHKVEGDQNTN